MLLFGVEMIRLWSLNYSWINYPTLHMVKGADGRRAHLKKKKKKRSVAVADIKSDNLWPICFFAINADFH